MEVHTGGTISSVSSNTRSGITAAMPISIQHYPFGYWIIRSESNRRFVGAGLGTLHYCSTYPVSLFSAEGCSDNRRGKQMHYRNGREPATSRCEGVKAMRTKTNVKAGAVMVEYGLMVALIAVACLAA